MIDRLVVIGTVVGPTGEEPLDVAVSSETISAVGPRGSLGGEARNGIDARGCLGWSSPTTRGCRCATASRRWGRRSAACRPGRLQWSCACRCSTTRASAAGGSRAAAGSLISTNPAKPMGPWPRKGRIAAGADADTVVFDPARRWTVRREDLHMNAGYSRWDGWELTGKVRDTVLRR